MNENQPRVSVVIPWCNRPELAETLEKNKVFDNPSIDLLIVNCGGDSGELDEILTRSGLSLRRIGLNGTKFNKCLALNLGSYFARSPALIFVDTDIILQDNFLHEALDKLGGRQFFTVARVFESSPTDRGEHPYLAEMAHLFEFVDRDGIPHRVETNRIRYSDGSRSGPGLILLRREDFEAVGGMNSDLQGWGWDDLDLISRLGFVLGLERVAQGQVLHLTHDDDVRDIRGGHRGTSEGHNFRTCLYNYSQGCYTGTYLDDVSSWKECTSVREWSSTRS